jgi:acylphosphatase
MADRVAKHLRITGRVQGVGYRFWTSREAERRGLAGWVRNRSDGSVEALLIGDKDAVDAMVDACRRGPRAASVADVEATPAADDGSSDFRHLPTV